MTQQHYGLRALITAVCFLMLASPIFGRVASPNSSATTASISEPSTTPAASLDEAIKIPTIMKAMKTCTGVDNFKYDCGTPDPENPAPEPTMIPEPFTNLYCMPNSRTTGSKQEVLIDRIVSFCDTYNWINPDKYNPENRTLEHIEDLPDGNTMTLEFHINFDDGHDITKLNKAACKAGFLLPVTNCFDEKKPLLRGGRVQGVTQGDPIFFSLSVRKTVKPMSIPPPKAESSAAAEGEEILNTTAAMASTTPNAATKVEETLDTVRADASTTLNAASCPDAICAMGQAPASTLLTSTAMLPHVRRADASPIYYYSGTNVTASAPAGCTDAACALRQTAAPCSDAMCVFAQILPLTTAVASSSTGSLVLVTTTSLITDATPTETVQSTTIITSLPPSSTVYSTTTLPASAYTTVTLSA